MEILRNLLTIVYLITIAYAKEKRLLLNDQDLTQRIHQLEVTVQKAVGEISALTQQKTALEGNLNDANAKISQLQAGLKVKTEYKGAIYTRWGRKDCPTNGTEMVYSGMAGGSFFRRTGGPANFLCLPPDPDFINGDTAYSGEFTSSLYGAEYEDPYFGSQLKYQDVPCAVCRSVHRSSVLMIPGKTKCYDGWHKEYYGRLATNPDHYNAASEYICVDQNADSLKAGGAKQDGKLLYAVKAICGSLHCPPFHDNALIRCVVCSN